MSINSTTANTHPLLCAMWGKPQTLSINCIRPQRITLSVSEGTVSLEPRPLADAQGYPLGPNAING